MALDVEDASDVISGAEQLLNDAKAGRILSFVGVVRLADGNYQIRARGRVHPLEQVGAFEALKTEILKRADLALEDG